MEKKALPNHNDYLFRGDGDQFRFIRDFEGMYRHCEDPHGQTRNLQNLSYQLVSVTLARAVEIVRRSNQGQVGIVDVGCGLGVFTAHIKALNPQARVCGLDISESAIRKARLRAPDCQFERWDIRSSLEDFPCTRPFDIAVALDSLYYFEDSEIGGVLENIRGLLVPGGFLMVGYHLPTQMRFGRYITSLQDARGLLHSHGMEIVYSFDVHNQLDATPDGSSLGHHLYFLARRQ